MFMELNGNSDFSNEYKKAYFEILKSRLALGSLAIENENEEVTSRMQHIKMFNQYSALEYVFNKEHISKFSHYDFLSYICHVTNILTSGEYDNFRKTFALVSGSNVSRSMPGMIRNDLIYLFDDYKYQIEQYRSNFDSKKSFDFDEIYKIEARFHIRFLYIHPFEDCNGRCARLILTRNLCEFDKAPCVLSMSHKREYCDYIENNDVNNLALFFKKYSEEELETMVALYKEKKKVKKM